MVGPGSGTRSPGERDGVPYLQGAPRLIRETAKETDSCCETTEKILTQLMRQGLDSPSQRR